MSDPGDRIFKKRRDFLVSFLPAVTRLYHTISMQAEDVNLFYESALFQVSMKEILQLSRTKDLQAQRTLAGIHRDDIDMQLTGLPFRNIASQGQRKSLLFALKLAELEILEKEKKFPPILLLDDVFEKLDSERMLNLLKKVCVENEGQVFITDTHSERLHVHLKELGVEYELINL